MNNIANTEISAYNEFRAQLAELKEYNGKIVFSYETPKGNKDARSHIHKLRKTKSAVDACRKKEKAASLEHGRKVDKEAKDIIGELEDMILVHKQPLDDIEEKEKIRVDSILSKLDAIRHSSQDTDELSSVEISERLDILQNTDITVEVFQELTEQAAGAKSFAIQDLEKLFNARKKYEDDQAEIERLRLENEKRQQKERDERIAKEAAEQEREAALIREKTLKDRAQKAALKAEQDKRYAAAKAVQAVKDAEAKVRQEAEEKVIQETKAQEKREANKQHRAKINRAAVAALVTLSSLSDEQAKDVITLIANKKIPNANMQY